MFLGWGGGGGGTIAGKYPRGNTAYQINLLQDALGY